MSTKRQQQLKLVCIPILYKSVFPNAEHVMGIANKFYAHNTEKQSYMSAEQHKSLFITHVSTDLFTLVSKKTKLNIYTVE